MNKGGVQKRRERLEVSHDIFDMLFVLFDGCLTFIFNLLLIEPRWAEWVSIDFLHSIRGR